MGLDKLHLLREVRELVVKRDKTTIAARTYIDGNSSVCRDTYVGSDG